MTMHATTPTPRDLLMEARTIIARPESWTKGAGARDASREPIVVEHQDAVSWCATGALLCTIYRHADSLEVPPTLQQAFDRAHAILTSTIRTLTGGRYTDISIYNDATNHSCIVHTFDIAITDAERLSTHPPS